MIGQLKVDRAVAGGVIKQAIESSKIIGERLRSLEPLLVKLEFEIAEKKRRDDEDIPF